MTTVGDMTTIPETKVGHGLKPSEKVIHKKYFIDLHKLHNNVLEVRYNKNRHLTNVKTQVIGHGVKKILNQIIDHDDMNQNDYHVLSDQERHLIRTILHMLDKSHLLSNADESLMSDFKFYFLNTMQGTTVKYYEIK
jgi:translation elongation factor EF-1beta